ncbi:MAG: hypothetical protein IKM32_03010 [Clostridia bacterium]|nr:hypothetical protein [Clostridia bacterium]MBR6783640.1 hypothetical protein [Clostridia bacterium]
MENTPVREKDPIVKKAAKKRRRRKNKFAQAMAVLIVFLAFYLLISLFIAGLIYYSFNSTAKNTEIYSLNVVYDETVLHKTEAQEANNEYGLYVPFSYLSEIGAFGLAGDGEDVTLFLIGTDNRIECKKNSSLVVINDNPIRISAPVLYENGDYLIPIVLIENYINGIDVSYDDEKMICKVSSDIGKADVELKLLLPEDMEGAYFPDEYKYYGDPNASTAPNE